MNIANLLSDEGRAGWGGGCKVHVSDKTEANQWQCVTLLNYPLPFPRH
jgi:hypothetical protein